MAVSAGTAQLQVAPILVKQFSRDLVQQMAGPAQRAATTTGRDAGRTFGRTFQRAGDDGARQFGVRFNKRLGAGFSASTKIASVAAGAIGGAFAAVQIGGFLKGAIDEAREAAKVGRQTAAVIKATGGVANVTARDVDRLVTALSNKVGVDDELITTGANLLLTFKGIRNETGRGNDVFNQAQAAILDMTAAMNEGVITSSGLRSSTIQVGKALNDPIKGMTALARVGVTFTEGQRDQIKALVEAGRTMDAQKIILRELSSEFGGAAKAAADPWQRVQVAFGNLKEDIGTVLLPAIESAADSITTKLIPAVERWWKEHGPKVRDTFSEISHIIGVVFGKLRNDFLPALAETAKFYTEKLQPAVDDVTRAWRDNKNAMAELQPEGKANLDLWKEISAFLGGVMARQVERAITLAGLFSRAWKVAADATNTAVEFLVVTFVEANRTIFRVAATAAEKLHLPFAKGLRNAEREMGGFVQDFKAKSADVSASAPGGSRSRFGQSLRAAERQMDGFRSSFNANIGALRGKNITIPIKGTFQPPKGFSVHSIVGATGGLVTPKAIVHRANGGPIRMGTGPKADDVPAMLSKGEYVINAKATSKHRGLIEAINRDGLPGFARGGSVDVDVLAPKMGRFASRIQRIIDTVGNRTASALQRMLRIFTGGGKESVKAFIRSADSLPYVWGGVGPGGYDCSGLAGEVMARHLGLPSFRRYFTTASIRAGQYGLRSGLGGVLQLGVTAGSGHMAGRYGGLGFEAESTRTGIKVGSAASRPESFARKYHLASGGPVDAQMVDALARQGVLDVGGDPGRLRINGQVFDRGGTLAPGLNLLANRTGRPEPLVPAGQGIDYNRLADAIARALERRPPVAVLSTSAFQAGMNAHAGRMGQPRPYR